MQKNEKIELDQLKKIRTSRKTGNNQRRLFCSKYGKERQMVKIALDARKLNENCVKKRPHMQTWKNY